MNVYHKMEQILLQNATAILSQNATKVYYKCSRFFIIKRDNYYKMRLFYYKMRRTLQNVSVHCKTKGN